MDATGGQSIDGLDLEEIETGNESCYSDESPMMASADPVAKDAAASQAFDDAVFADKKRFFESVQRHHPKK